MDLAWSDRKRKPVQRLNSGIAFRDIPEVDDVIRFPSRAIGVDSPLIVYRTSQPRKNSLPVSGKRLSVELGRAE
jgi:hypothetical protein